MDEIEGTTSVVLELHVAPEDMGRIIGRKGRVANAMRTLVMVLGGKEGKRVTLEIVESLLAEVAAEEVAPEEEGAPTEEAAPIGVEIAEEVPATEGEMPF